MSRHYSEITPPQPNKCLPCSESSAKVSALGLPRNRERPSHVEKHRALEISTVVRGGRGVGGRDVPDTADSAKRGVPPFRGHAFVRRDSECRQCSLEFIFP